MKTCDINKRLLEYHIPISPSFSPLPPAGEPTPPFVSTSLLTFDMSDQSGPSHLQALFEAAVQDYEKQTCIVLAKHPLAEKLQNCDSVESVNAVFHEQTEAFSQYRRKDKVLEPLKNTVSVLHKLSATADSIGLVSPQVIIVFDVSNLCLIAFPACESSTH